LWEELRRIRDRAKEEGPIKLYEVEQAYKDNLKQLKRRQEAFSA